LKIRSLFSTESAKSDALFKRPAAESTALPVVVSGGWEQNQSLPPIRRPQPAIEAGFRPVAEQ
jgi:hypothetical protein